VMRLARPKFSEILSFPVDPVDPTGFPRKIEAALCKRDGEKRHDVPIGEYLMAPQMFENIYLGETFTFYVNCVNESDQKVTDVSVKCDLQTNSQRLTLPSNIHDAVLEAKMCSGQVISHEIKEIGQHILICSVNYKTLSDEKMYFRKFFKFPVGKPFDVKTKFYNAEVCILPSVSPYILFLWLDLYVAMVLERVELEPSSSYSVANISSWFVSNLISYRVYNYQIVFSDADELTGMHLKPRDIRQFLFRLTSNDSQNAVYKDLTNIGKLDMSWRTSMGERGRLQTSPLQRIPPAHGDVRLSVENLPATVSVRKPFTLGCMLQNCCERSLDLRLELQNSSQSLVFCSVSGVSLGQVPPCGSVSFSVEILPVSIGFQSISGLRIVDSFSKRTYDHDDVAQVFV
ncbi:hypothetical protein Angca_006558, partial [Angiostrongylus cantonensis]